MILPKMALQHPMMLGKIPIIFMYLFFPSLFFISEKERDGGKKERKPERKESERDR